MFRINPQTARLDDIGTPSAGGGGTVTSVGGGVGWTPTPDPIVGAGVGNLDIFDLTAETALAAGDWFAFVDVSVGTTPASQRRVTFANLGIALNTVLDHGLLLGNADDDHLQYLLLAGRAGTANDALLSTTVAGSLTGSSAAGLGLNLIGSSNATRAGVFVNNVTFTHASGTFGAFRIPMTVTNDGGSAINAIEIGQSAGSPNTWSMTTAPVGRALVFGPRIQNTTAGVVTDLGAWLLFANGATFRSNNTAAMTMAELRTFTDVPVFAVVTGGDLTCALMTTVYSQPNIGTSCTVSTRRGLWFREKNALGAGTQTDVIGYDYEAQTAAGLNIFARNQDSAAETRHAGPGVYGANAGPTNASVGLEVQSTTRAMLLSRMTTAQKTTLTGVAVADGMLLYDSTTNKLNARENGAWIEFQPLDADLTAYAALVTAGLVARTGAGTVATRTLTGPAAGISVANGDGVAGNPTLSLVNDLSALEGLGSTGLAARTAADTWAQRTIVSGNTTRLTVTNPGGVAGNPTLNPLQPQTAARGQISGSQSITSATDTPVEFDGTDIYDTSAIHDPSSNNTRFTVPTTGLYLIHGSVEFAANAIGSRVVAIQKDGTTLQAVVRRNDVSAAASTIVEVSTIINMAATTYIEMIVNQNSGGALNVTADATTTYLAVVRLSD